MNVFLTVVLTISALCLVSDSYLIYKTYKRITNKVVEEEVTEIPEEFNINSHSGSYNINKFKDRMEGLKKEVVDDVVLYELPPQVDRSNIPGVEVITESAEIEFEKRIMR